jgi:hypothetical protein
MRSSHATASLAPLLAVFSLTACSLTAPEPRDSPLVPVSGAEQRAAIEDFWVQRVNSARRRAAPCMESWLPPIHVA